MKTKQAKNEQVTRVVFEDAYSRIERVSDRWYAEYVLYIGGAYYSSGYSTQLEAENARDAAVHAALVGKAA